MQEVDTFDEGPYTEGPMESEDTVEEHALGDEDGTFDEIATEGQDSEEVSSKAEETEDIDPNSQVNLLDEKEDLGEEKAAKEPVKRDEEPESKDEGKESDESPKDDVAKDDGDSAEEIRTLKAFREGKAYEIPEDAQIKVKVAGKSEKVTLSELRDNYSGKVHYDEKFSELSEQNKTFSQEKEVYEQEIGLIRDHLGTVANLVKSAMDGETSPTAGMEYLLDLMGGNTLQYKKAVYEHMADEFDTYSEMTEFERDSYWTKQENEYLTKRQESFQKNQSTEKAQAEFQNKVSSLREAHSISEDDYVSAEQDLKAGGQENISPEQIVQAAQLKPLLEAADGLIEPYLEQMTEEEASEMAVDIATTMFSTPTLSIDQVKQLLAEQYKVEELVTGLEQKIEKRTGKNVAKQSAPTEGLDFFD